MTYEEFMAGLRLTHKDPAQHARFRSQHGELIGIVKDILKTERKRPRPLAQVADLTALQVTLFDNWPNGPLKKGHPKGFPHRYKIGIKVWDGPAQYVDFDEEPDWKGNIILMKEETMIEKLVDLQINKAEPISLDYAQFATAVMAEYPGQYYGLLSSKPFGSGTVYHDHQMMRIEIDAKGHAGEAELFLLNGKNFERLILPPWSPLDAGKNPLPGKAKLHSRHSRHARLRGWSTLPSINLQEAIEATEEGEISINT